MNGSHPKRANSRRRRYYLDDRGGGNDEKVKIKEADLTDWEASHVSISPKKTARNKVRRLCGKEDVVLSLRNSDPMSQKRANRSGGGFDAVVQQMCACSPSVPHCNWSSFCSNEWRAAAEDKSLVTRPFFSNEF